MLVITGPSLGRASAQFSPVELHQTAAGLLSLSSRMRPLVFNVRSPRLTSNTSWTKLTPGRNGMNRILSSASPALASITSSQELARCLAKNRAMHRGRAAFDGAGAGMFNSRHYEEEHGCIDRVIQKKPAQSESPARVRVPHGAITTFHGACSVGAAAAWQRGRLARRKARPLLLRPTPMPLPDHRPGSIRPRRQAHEGGLSSVRRSAFGPPASVHGVSAHQLGKSIAVCAGTLRSNVHDVCLRSSYWMCPTFSALGGRR
jgi:hypothetical protein